MIYCLWTLAIGWGLFLNKMEILSILLFLVYLFLSETKIICWRYLSIAFIISVFNLLICKLGYFDRSVLLITFLLVEALFSANLSIYASKLSFYKILGIYLFVSISFLMFMMIAMVLSHVVNDYIYLQNIYVYITLIFLPSFLLMSLQLFKIKAWNH